ncbi:BQ5605_C008g04983 [Microbotryum silenes-dioicae]|uniref:BQ5605_C008g04983 protein n=1 Tax=Microbotryum silenes-dioicae TaxID=796604 RepID=A0A2X0MC12_9BASI|nr:BQ5605_C008g04983 [Microbotryum silenes-dioicae]
MRGKKAVVVSKKTWEDGTSYEQLKYPLCEVEYIFIKCMRNVRWSELIFTSSFRERIKLLVYDEAILIAEWGLTARDEKTESALWRIPPRDPTHFAPSMLKLYNNVSELVIKLSSLLRPTDLFHLRNIVVEMTPHTKTAMTNVLTTAVMSLLSDLPILPPHRSLQAQYVYSGPLLRNSPVSALDDHGSPEGAFSPGAPRGRILQEESACERAIPTSAPLVVRSPL